MNESPEKGVEAGSTENGLSEKHKSSVIYPPAPAVLHPRHRPMNSSGGSRRRVETHFDARIDAYGADDIDREAAITGRPWHSGRTGRWDPYSNDTTSRSRDYETRSSAKRTMALVAESSLAKNIFQNGETIQQGALRTLGTIVFTLCRRSGSDTLPESVPLSGGSRPLVVGRAANCDVVLRIQHISKAHAQLHVQETDLGTWILMLQDTSSNGTWLNGEKVSPRRFHRVRPGDRVSFLPPSLGDTDLDPPIYELVSGALETETSHAIPPPTIRQHQSINDHNSILSAGASAASDYHAATGPPAGCSDNQRHYSTTDGFLPNTTEGEWPLNVDGNADGEGCPQYDMRTNSQSSCPASSTVRTVHSFGPDTETAPALEDGVAPVEDQPTEISQWVQSLGGPELSQYDELLFATYDDLKQIRALYSEHIEDFFEDVCIQNPEHREIFRDALVKLRNHSF